MRTNRDYFLDLESGQEVFLLKGSFEAYAVPDKAIHDYLNTFSVSGIKKPYRFAPTEPFVFHGNVLNPTTAAINLGGRCNSHCRFCYTEWLRNIPNFKTDETKRVLDKLSKIKSIDTLVLSGGEATIRADLQQLIEYARRLGFSTIGLQTNGRALHSSNYVRSLVQAGLSHVLLSLHGACQLTHDSITGAEGSYYAVLNGLNNLLSASVSVVINTVICSSNVQELRAIPRVLARFGANRVKWRLSYPILEGAAYENRADLLVSFSELKPYLEEAMAEAHTVGLALQTGTMPPCIGRYPELTNTYTVDELRSFVEVSPFYNYNIPRGEVSAKFKSCQTCSAESQCRGIQVEYLKLFPDAHSEFQPIP